MVSRGAVHLILQPPPDITEVSHVSKVSDPVSPHLILDFTRPSGLGRSGFSVEVERGVVQECVGNTMVANLAGSWQRGRTW